MIFNIKNLYICISWKFCFFFLGVVFFNKIHEFLLCFLALILHELGHIFAIAFLEESISIFYVLPFGFCCRLKNQEKIQDKKMIKILLAGPVASLMVAGISFLWTKDFAIVNLIIGILNLTPVGNLDGGRLIKFFCKI